MARLDIEIEIAGPFVTAGVVTRAFGIDTTVLRDHKGCMILPGTLVKGVVRDVLEEMAQAAPKLLSPDTLLLWFGTPTRNEQDVTIAKLFEPDRAAVRFRDLCPIRSADKISATATMTRIAVDAERGSVKHGALQVIEAPIALGQPVLFGGAIDVDAPANPEQVRTWVERALQFVPAVGGIKSAGSGRILGASIKLAPEPPSAGIKTSKLTSDPSALSRDDVVRYALVFDEPFLVGSESIGGNLFKGSTVVPGAAVKGALADDLERLGKAKSLEQALDGAIFRHAKPAILVDGRVAPRPRAMPLSLYSVEQATIDGVKFVGVRDALWPSVDPVEDAATGLYVTFPPDWKGSPERDAKLAHYNQAYSPTYNIRTRTAIDAAGLAATGQLFSRLAVVPGDHVWVGEVARGTADAGQFREFVAHLARGLSAIGKTNARAAVAILPPETTPLLAPIRREAGRAMWRLVLETDALLHGPGAAHAFKEIGDPAERLQAQYRNYFASALGLDAAQIDRLRLFASQRWAGGYQALRYPHYDDVYYPQLITQAGSVFELTLPDTPHVQARMQAFRDRGLPLPARVPANALQYKRSAFNPENGYGEVSIDARDLVTGAS